MSNAASLGSYGVGLELTADSFFTDWGRAEQFQTASVGRMKKQAEAMNDAFADVDTSGVRSMANEARKAGEEFAEMAKKGVAATNEMVTAARETYDKIAEESKVAAIAISVAIGTILAGTIAGALYVTYKVVKETTGFIVGLLTGSSYKNEYVEDLVAASKANKEFADSLEVSLAQAAALNDTLKFTGKSAGEYVSVFSQVQNGIRANADEYARLGIATRNQNGQFRAQGEILADVNKTLQGYTEGWDRNAAATALGFASSKAVADAVAISSRALDEGRLRLEDYHLVLGPGQLAAAEEFTRATREFTHNAELTKQGFSRAIGDSVMPMLTDLADFFKDGWPKVVTAFRVGTATIATIAQGLVNGLFIITEPIVAVFSSLATSIATVVSASMKALKGDFAGAQNALAEGRREIAARWTEAFDGIAARSTRTWDNIKMAWGQDDKGPAAAAKKSGKEWEAATKEVKEFESELDKLLKRLENNDSGVNAQFWKELQMLNEEFADKAPERYVKLVEELIRQTKFGQAEFRKMIDIAKEQARAFDEAFEAEQRLLDLKTNAIKDIRLLIEANRFEAQTMGMANDARAAAIATRAAEAAGIDTQTQAYRDFIEQLKASVRDKDLAQSNLQFWQDAQMYSERTIENIVTDWSGGLKQIGKDIQHYIVSQLAKMATTQWVLPIVAQFTGLSMPGQLAGAAGGSGGSILGSLLQGGSLLSGNSLLNGAASLANTLGLSSVSNFLGGMTGAIQGPTMTGAALGGSAALAGSQLSSMMSFAGPIAAAIAASVMSYKKWGGAGILGPLSGMLFGRKREVNMDASGIMGDFGWGTFSGQTWQDKSQRGGLFRSDKRWTDYSAMGSDQAAGFQDSITAIKELVKALAGTRGTDADSLLSGFSRSFKITTKDRSDEDIKKDIDAFLKGILSDQVLAVLGETSESIRARIRDFAGSADELTAYVTDMVAAFQFVKDFDGGKVTESFEAIGKLFRTGVDQSALASLDVLETQIASMVEAIDDMAANGGDFVEMGNLASQIYDASIQRYQMELDLIQKISDSLATLQSDAYEFSMSIGGKINALGGRRDLGALSMARANDLRAGLGSQMSIAGQQQAIQAYVGAIDNWLAERTAEINAEAQAQANAMQTFAQMQQAANSARIDQLGQELDAINELNAVAARAREMLKDVQLSSANPMSAFGRFAMAGDFAASARASFFGADNLADKSKYGNEYLDALQARLELLGETFQRPSPEYLAGYNAIMEEVAAAGEFAQTDAERGLEIQAQILSLTEANNALASMTFDAASFAADALGSVNAEAIEYYEWAERTYLENNKLMQDAYNAQLQAITGGVDVNLFTAERAAEGVSLLQRLVDLMEKMANGGDAIAGTGSSGTGTGTGSGTGGGGLPLILNIDGATLGTAVIRAAQSNGRALAQIVEMNQR